MALTFQTASRHGYSVCFSPFFPNRLACAASQHFGIAGSGRVYVLDVLPDHGIELVRTVDWSNGLFDVCWSEDNENVMVTSSGDGTLQVWDVMQARGPLKVMTGHTKEVYSVAWSQTRDEHFFLSASWDTSIKMWDIHRTECVSTFLGHESLVYSAVWSPHLPACFLSVSGDHTLRLWDARSPTSSPWLVVPAHNAEVLTGDWSKYDQNAVFTGGVDGVVQGWDIRMPYRNLCHLAGHQLAVRRVKTSPHLANILATSSYDFTVKIWDLNSAQCVDTIEHHSEFVYGLDFNLHIPGQLADCSWDELVRVYTLSSCCPGIQPTPTSTS